MTLDQIRIFLEMARQLHVTRAAKTLNLTQSTVSAAIQALEERHAVRLFEWLGRRIAALHPVILAPGRRKGVAGARVILAPSRALLRDAAGALARHLLARGYLFMDFDGDSKDGFPPSLFWTRSPPVQVLGAHDAETIDLTFSELVFIPPAGLLNGA